MSFPQRDENSSLDFGELDELLDDVSSKTIHLHFSGNKYAPITVVVYMQGGIDDHIIDKMKKLYNLQFITAEPEDDELRVMFHYTGNYFNKAEDRKKREEKEMDKCVGDKIRKLSPLEIERLMKGT